MTTLANSFINSKKKKLSELKLTDEPIGVVQWGKWAKNSKILSAGKDLQAR